MKKLLVIALVVATVLGTAGVASASFTDVTGPVAEAAEKLAGLGIAQGMTATSFGPAQNVTRAQMAAFIVRSLGLEASATASKGATLFTDVAANYWGSGYVNVASSMGIIVGHQGRFRPEDPVKFSEAATMMVRALGYTDAEVAALGAWPTGHIAKATELGLLAGVTAFSKDANANRGNIALLVKNMVFDAPAKADGKTLAVSVFKVFNIASIVVTPATTTAAIGELKEFKAVGKDASGADVALEGVVWSVTGKAVVQQDGKFTAYGSGPCVVKATVGDLSGTAAVHVAGAPAAVKLTLGSTSLTDNGTSTVNLKVNVVDAAGVVVPTGEPTVNLAISGASFKVGTAT
ncbi:MAG: S-layer homology domain-containing protein, partial [Bacillota bacterium]